MKDRKSGKSAKSGKSEGPKDANSKEEDVKWIQFFPLKSCIAVKSTWFKVEL